jgi:non-specific serine/threonine protein kinase
MKELIVDIMPSQELVLTWENFGERLGKKQQALNLEIHTSYSENDKKWLLFLGCSDNKIPLSPSLNFWRGLAQIFLEKLKRTPDIEDIRHNADIDVLPEELDNLMDAAPLMIGREYLDRPLLSGLCKEMNQLFSREIEIFPGSVKEFFHKFSPHIHLAGRVYFHLVESKDDAFPFQFLATYATQSENSQKHRPLHYALEEYRDHQDQLLELLTTVHAAAQNSDLLKGLLDTGELFHHLAWDTQDAYDFLQQIINFEHCGIICRIPDWWKKKSSKPMVKISLGTSEPSFMGMNTLLDFQADILMGDTPITLEEAQELLAQTSGLARIKNRWIEVDKQRLQNLLNAYEKAVLKNDTGLTIKEALQLQLHPDRLSSGDKTDLEISNGEWLESIVKRLNQPELVTSADPAQDFVAILRHYQQKGLNWLSFLDSLGFGACLADDMGLGKTIQILGFLSILRIKEPDKTSLLIIPASLISNWENEILKFLPNLKYYIAHPSYIENGIKKGHDKRSAQKPDLTSFNLVITTYAMAQRHKWMEKVHWRCLILDEAQAIKNPVTQQSKQVKRLKAATKITMTGTPLENSLVDLWSLFDFLNPGLLGTAKEFKTFSAQLKKEPSRYQQLKKVISPFILRRMKTDKAIAPDLPEKIEMKTFPQLSKKQVVLYTDFVKELEARLAQADQGIQRKGLILSSLMKFKQICNHPDQYLGTGDFDPRDSGKFIRLGELCETIYAKRERVLVFTQFKEMTAPIAKFLETIFHHQGCIIHGSLGVKKRKQVIEQFQQQAYLPFMVLSLKAGGVGLNLTRANHVIHFDRWWNPAVEDQATDRAFRIGQKKGVLVHKFITKGTIEDNIDQMIESKKELSKKIITDSQASLITGMDNQALLDMFKLKL